MSEKVNNNLRGIIAEPSGIRVTEEDASLILGMVGRGDRKHDVAAYFGINNARVYDVMDGKLHPGIEPAPLEKLPPPGPYPNGRNALEMQEKLNHAYEMLDSLRNVVNVRTERIGRVLKSLE